jgi:hypothetical protein
MEERAKIVAYMRRIADQYDNSSRLTAAAWRDAADDVEQGKHMTEASDG